MIDKRKKSYKSANRYKTLVNILGKQYISGSIESPIDFISIAGRGVNSGVINNFRNYFGLTRDRTADLLQVSEPTLYRWTKAQKTLDRNYSVQLFELADLFLFGIEVMNGSEDFFKWLELPNTALGGMEPMDLLEVPEGIAKVRDLLGRIKHSVYS